MPKVYIAEKGEIAGKLADIRGFDQQIDGALTDGTDVITWAQGHIYQLKIRKLLQARGQAFDLDFKCPNGHNTQLINTRNGLFMHCDECDKWYSL